MTRLEYMHQLFTLYNKGEISAEAYDAGIMNTDIFCDEDESQFLNEN